MTPPTNSQPQELLLEWNILYCLLTDDGASGRPPNGLVEEGRGESKVCALCSGNAGVADLDISHAFAKEIWKRKPDVNDKKCVICVVNHCSSRLNWDCWGEARSRSGGDAIWQQLQTGVFQTGDGTRWGLGDRVRSTNLKTNQPRRTPGDK